MGKVVRRDTGKYNLFMNTTDNDPFAYRSQGGQFEVGSDETDTMSAFIKVDDQLMCITRKNIRTVLMADTIDPQRTNPNIDHNVQHVLPYGSDNEFVGRTFQQASLLFKEHALPKSIDCIKGVSISFSFLKELTALEKLKNEYAAEERNITSTVPLQGSNPQIPGLPNLEQRVKSFIMTADMAKGLILDLVILFYSDVKPQKNDLLWEDKFLQKIAAVTNQQDFVNFITNFKQYTQTLRELSNWCRHPHDQKYSISIENYKLSPENILDVPSISFSSGTCTLPKMRVAAFIDSTTFNLLTIFELLTAYLCNLHAEPFAGDKRVVVSVPADKRKGSEKHVGFQYQILWTK